MEVRYACIYIFSVGCCRNGLDGYRTKSGGPGEYQHLTAARLPLWLLRCCSLCRALAGYYGPEWFNDGIFIGAGPWFHGPEHFWGHVDNHFHPEHGYRGEMPHRGERPDAGRRVNAAHFKGNEMRDGRGHRR